MTTACPRLIVGNWKMNGSRSALMEVVQLKTLIESATLSQTEIVICPPATLLAAVSEVLKGSGIATGGQDCHDAASGAYTGGISGGMLADAGAKYVILGHSERRRRLEETNWTVRAKVAAAFAAGLVPIICVGESRVERDRGLAAAVVGHQLMDSIPDLSGHDDFVVAYEPAWAIGSGRTPSRDEIADMHAIIRQLLLDRFGTRGAAVRILYGGSLKPANAAEILSAPCVDGGLVGTASLSPTEFYRVITAAA